MSGTRGEPYWIAISISEQFKKNSTCNRRDEIIQEQLDIILASEPRLTLRSLEADYPIKQFKANQKYLKDIISIRMYYKIVIDYRPIAEYCGCCRRTNANDWQTRVATRLNSAIELVYLYKLWITIIPCSCSADGKCSKCMDIQRTIKGDEYGLDIRYRFMHSLYKVPDMTDQLAKIICSGPHHCAICLEGFTPALMAFTPFCHHMFHRKCIKRWLKKNRTCPICRLLFLERSGKRGPVPSDHDMYECLTTSSSLPPDLHNDSVHTLNAEMTGGTDATTIPEFSECETTLEVIPT